MQTTSGVTDNISDESAPRLYRNVPVGVYASAIPYAAYSFNVPTFVEPKNTQVIPIKEENVIVQNSNGFLKDSYGQRFVGSPQTVAYKTTFPQQFVQLQNLPAHLSQPLLAAAPSFQYGQAPYFFGQTQFRIPNIQTLAPTHINQFSAQPLVYANNVRNLAPTASFPSYSNGNPTVQQQSTSNKNVYANTLTAEQFNKLRNEPKFQRVQEEPKISSGVNNNNNDKQTQSQIAQANKLQLVQVPKETSITTVTNGKKTVVNLITKPPLPLLDLTLLEPLTFKNPLVPQVQHFLPRINQATYKRLPEVNEVKKHQMEFIVQNTKSYDSGLLKNKPKAESPKKKYKKQSPQNEVKNEEEGPPNNQQHGGSDENPGISYENKSPTYKETITEHKMSYNKETQSEPVSISYEKQTQKEPVHYSYEQHTEKEPIHYSYSHTSKEPAQIQQIYYESNDDTPKHLIYHFKPEQKKEDQGHRQSTPPQNESEESSDASSEESELDRERHQRHEEHKNKNQEHQRNVGKTAYIRPEHRDQVHYHFSNNAPGQFRQDSSQPRKPHVQYVEKFLQPIAEYEEDITILPTHKPHAEQNNQNYHVHINHAHPSQKKNQRHYEYPQNYHSSEPTVHEKSKRIIVTEGTTSEIDKPNDELMAEMVKKQEESEEDFEKAYKDAAYGFPGYDTPSIDIEKEIYNPEAYGASRYRHEYDVEKSPLRQYEPEGDDYPAFTRAQYKDARDKQTDDYYLDYAVSRPESLRERHKNKENYYELYKNQKPEIYFGNEDKDQKRAKYTAALSYGHFGKPQQKQQSKYRVPQSEEYNYNKEAPQDNSSFSSRPHQRYKSNYNTQFVEPQFQYGFEPLSSSRLLDSELAAMASNNNPKTEKLSNKKKIYKESWYIKKSSKSGKTGS